MGALRQVIGLALLLSMACFCGCNFAEAIPPDEDRARQSTAAIALASAETFVASPLTPEAAVALALRNNLDLKAAAIELSYHEEVSRGGMLRLLPRLQAEVDVETRNHYDSSYSESPDNNARLLNYSYSRDRTQTPLRLSMLWNILDFGAGYIRVRQTGERILQSREQMRRLRQQTAFETCVAYWRALATSLNAADAEELVADLEQSLASVREAKAKGVLGEGEGARRELTLINGIVEAERIIQDDESARRELARVLGLSSLEFSLDAGAVVPAELAALAESPLNSLQWGALCRRPELFQGDAQARISLDDARLAVLQMAPNANLRLAFEHNDDSHLQWNDWMSAGVRISWNLLSLPARLSERKAALLQSESMRQKNLAMSAAVLAQVGLASGEWRQATRMHGRMRSRLDTRRDLVEALMRAEKAGQARAPEVVQERIRLLGDRAAVRLQEAETRVALTRLANAVGLDIDDDGHYAP